VKKVVRAFVPLLAAVFVLAMTGAASASPAGNSLQFDEHDTFFHYVDHGAPGPGPGDEFIVRGAITSDGVNIGAIKVVCTLTGHSGRSLCNIAFRFGPFDPNATRLYLQGLYNPKRPSSSFAVVGGTNQYQGASGTGVRTAGGQTDASWVVLLN
jgi:hypothetical protein